MKHLLIILCTAFLLSACNKYIDIDEKGKVIPKTIQDFSDLMNDYNGFIVSTDNMFYLSDQIKVYPDEVNRIFYGADVFLNGYLWKDYLFVNADDNDRDWNNFYRQIYVCNVVLDNIEQAQGTDEALRKQTKGDALAQRAYAYFMLVNMYSKHYNQATYDKDAGVPLYLKPDINASKGRATVKEVYDQIEADLLEAEKLLPPQPAYNYHPGKAGVYGLLAQMYLYQQKWEAAESYAEKALQIHSFLYNLNNFDFIPGLPPFLGVPGYPTQAKDNEEDIWHKQSTIPFIYMIAVYMTDAQRALYDDGDRRLHFTEIDGAIFGPPMHGKSLFVIDRFYRAGIFTPDLYLIRAEANARLNHPDLAIEDLNILRKSRFLASKYIPYTLDKTQEEALQLVLKERKVELFQTAWRWFDLKRFNQIPESRKSVSRKYDGQTITLKPEDNNWVLPIPKKVLTLNSLMEQNPRDNRQ